MGNQHDEYGKKLFEGIRDFSIEYADCNTKYGERGRGSRIDGVIGKKIAIEIESRVSKQIRGAILDLTLHLNPRKLLILMPVHMNNPEITKSQSIFILKKLLDRDQFEVVLLKGTGDKEAFIEDKKRIRIALKALGIN